VAEASTFDVLKAPAMSSLFAETAAVFKADRENPIRHMQGP
jgi:hypothetical protein